MDKTKALDAALSQIERAFGKGSIMRLGKNQKAVEIETISTGSLGLDIALGVGGLPRGRVVEIYGPESSGKTTLTLHVIAEAQKAGGVCAFVDAEHALDPIYARKLGVNLEDLLISQPDTGEQALEITDTLVRSGAIDVLVVDSVAALTPRAEIEGEMGDVQPGLQARLMSQALRKLTASISRSNTLVIFINQIRMKIGVMYGSPETTTGGNALKFYASVRLDIRRIGAIKERDEAIGNQTRVKVVKNKVAPPFKQVEFDIMYGEGVSKVGELIDLGVKAGVVEKSGAWFSYDSQRLGQGRENAKSFLRAEPGGGGAHRTGDPRERRPHRREDPRRRRPGGRRIKPSSHSSASRHDSKARDLRAFFISGRRTRTGNSTGTIAWRLAAYSEVWFKLRKRPANDRPSQRPHFSLQTLTRIFRTRINVSPSAEHMIDYARPLLAFLCFLLIAYAVSDDRYKIPWRVVVSGIGLQIIFAMLLLYLPPVKHLLLLASDAAHAVQTATDAGSSFVFGYLGGGAAPFEEKNPGASFILAFKALPMILTISALASLFFYWGVARSESPARSRNACDARWA